MNEFSPLTRPSQSQITIDSAAKECPSEGFNYPNFRLLNKYARLFLSKGLELEPSISYHLFDIANLKGWFVAVAHSSSGSDLIVSTLEDLRLAFPSAKEDNPFDPKRIISIPCRANIVKFACEDTRLLVGQDNGSILLYDTSQLFTEGAFEVYPITSTHIQTTYLRQIIPNPGTETGLRDLVAVVANGKVQLVNDQLEPQGGWVATDDATQPVAVDWSPKGKHLAIGLQSGDILTFSLTNKSAPHKHLPPTADAPLASLRWLGPGHTFRTTYARTSPIQHVVMLDTKSSTASYVAPEHPYPSIDRTNQTSYTISLPRWDTDSSSNDDSKFLTIVGDALSADLEILGNTGNSWYRQSQDNPLSLPLDNSANDTILLALEVDLTDSTTTAPIMYAYLNDGSLQGWHLEHSKPYAGMMIHDSASSMALASTPSQESGKDSEMSGQQTSTSGAFDQQSTTSSTSTFGQSDFGMQTTSAFGGQQTTAFGQTGFGQKSPQTTSAFEQSSFGQPSFGAMPSFSQPSPPSTTTPAFGDVKPGSAFSAFSGSGSSPFGSGTSGGFGSTPGNSVFGGLGSGTSNVFGQGNFPATTTNPPPGNASPSHSPVMTREASMSDSTPGFGGMGLGSATSTDSNAVNSMFGSFSTTSSSTSSNSTTSAFGGSFIKPASGFGAFGNTQTSNAFDPKPAATSTSFGGSNQPAATSAFGGNVQPTTASAFGKTGFATANPAFGKPAFGQSTFGKPSMGPPAVPSPAVGGFGAFASTPTSFASAAQNTSTAAPTSGGFGAFASATPSAFGSLSSNSTDSKPASGGAFSAFASSSPSAFGAATETKPSQGAFGAFSSAPPTSGTASGSSNATSTDAKNVFGGPSFSVANTSPFGTPAKSPFGSPVKSPFGTPVKSPFGNTTADSPDESPKNSNAFSPASSPEPSKSPSIKQSVASSAPSASHAFSDLTTTPSVFKPAAGFGAFGGFETPASSPFFRKLEDAPQQPVSVFGLGNSIKTPTIGAATPTFGSSSALGGPKSAFAPIVQPSTTPIKSPSMGGFGAFSSSSGGFSAFAGSKSSFSDLLKTGGEETKDPVKPALSDKVTTTQEGASVLETPRTPPKNQTAPPISAFAPISKSKEKEASETNSLSKESTFESISASSASSSFVEINADESRGEVQDSDEDAAHSDDDANSFISDDSYHEEDDEEENGSEEGELADDGRSPSPRPQALSRSPSATPQPETPSIAITTSLDVDTTPPATPAKESKPLSGTSSSPQTPAATSPSPFGLGLGRPSTRPTRSSPLANAVSNDEEEDEKKPVASPRLPASSPKVPVEILPLKSDDDKKKDDSSSKRPKTPPLLSTLASNSAPVIVPSLSPPVVPPVLKNSSFFSEPSSSTIKPSSPAGSPFGIGAQLNASVSAPNLFGMEKMPEISRSKSDAARPATPPTSFFAMTPPPVPSSLSKPGFSMPVLPAPQPSPGTAPSFFGIKSPSLPSTIGPGLSSSLVGKSASSPSPFGTSPSPSGTPSHNFFGQPSSAPTVSPFGTTSPVTSQQHAASAFSLGAKPSASPQVQPAAVPLPETSSPAAPSPLELLEEGMQKECLRLALAVSEELATLRKMTADTLNTFNLHKVSVGGSKLKADLAVRAKWRFDDLQQFGKVLQLYQADLDLLASQRESSQQAVREIQSNMVKAAARREEIARFNKAKNDQEFAKMLKARTLGPEHSETQAQLRKSIRTILDRVQKLEMRLQEGKKKLAESTSFKPSFRAPTLDTINRTYRNIELTIEQQSDEVARLASRIARIKVSEPAAVASPRPKDSRLPDEHRRPYNVTPTVAATTAAALNAERSAHRLKKALLAVRKEPLLNTTAAEAPAPPAAFDTPRKPSSSAASAFSGSPGGFAFQTPLTEPLFSSAPLTPAALPDWDIPEDNFNPTPLAESSGRRGAGSGQRKHPSVPLKRSTGSAPAPAPAGFEWGPLPNFSSTSAGPKTFVPFSTNPTGFTGFTKK